MIKFSAIRPGKEGDKVELIRVAAQNGALLGLLKKVDLMANEIADTMTLAYGGDWRIVVDHQRRSVMIFAE